MLFCLSWTGGEGLQMLLCCSVFSVSHTHTRITAAPLKAHKIPASSPTLIASTLPTERKCGTVASQTRIAHDNSPVGQKRRPTGWNTVQRGSPEDSHLTAALLTCRSPAVSLWTFRRLIRAVPGRILSCGYLPSELPAWAPPWCLHTCTQAVCWGLWCRCDYCF